MAQVTSLNGAAPLMATTWDWRTPMVETLKRLSVSELLNMAFSGISAAGAVSVAMLWLTGALSANAINADKFNTLTSHIVAIDSTLAKLQERMDNGPRLDQLHDIDHHLSAQDGRMDSIDTRMRDIETRVTRALTQLESIDAANRAPLQGRR